MSRRSDKGELWITAQPTHQTWRIPQPSTSLASRCTVELYACIFTSHKMKPILCEETSVLRGHMAPIKYSCMSFIKLEISLPQILVNTSPGLLSTLQHFIARDVTRLFPQFAPWYDSNCHILPASLVRSLRLLVLQRRDDHTPSNSAEGLKPNGQRLIGRKPQTDDSCLSRNLLGSLQSKMLPIPFCPWCVQSSVSVSTAPPWGSASFPLQQDLRRLKRLY